MHFDITLINLKNDLDSPDGVPIIPDNKNSTTVRTQRFGSATQKQDALELFGKLTHNKM